MTRSRTGRGPIALVNLVKLVALTSLVAGCASQATAADGQETESRSTVPVLRQDLVAVDEFPGRLGYGTTVPLVAGRDGILTWLPAPGTVVRRGGVVAEIDGAATRLLLGDRPAWRRLAVGEPDGPDIAQLNANLAALGYAGQAGLPEARFDWRTRAAVYRWQRDLGVRQTGAVELGDVQFQPATVRVGAALTQPGTPVGTGEPLVQVTGTKQIVTVELEAQYRDRLAEGTAVAVRLPDRSHLDATVRSVGQVATAPATPDDDVAAEPTVPVEIGLADGEADELGGLEAAPVVVRVDRVLAEDVLTVPVAALVALADRGYAVERARAGGTELVTVRPGVYAEGLVEITGRVTERDEVVVP